MPIDQETFEAVDAFVEATLAADDEALRGAVEAAEAAGLRAIQVSAAQGRLLTILARLVGARRGPRVRDARRLQHDSAGARAGAGGAAVHARARSRTTPRWRGGSIERAGFGEWSRSGSGRRWRACRGSTAEGAGPFDLVFIDADKVEHARLLRVVAGADPARRADRRRQRRPRRRPRRGPTPATTTIEAQRRLHEELAAEPQGRSDDDPDRRGQGLRWLHDRPREVAERAIAASGGARSRARAPAIFPGRPIGPKFRPAVRLMGPRESCFSTRNRSNEGSSFRQADVREVQGDPPQRRGPGDLPEPAP